MIDSCPISTLNEFHSSEEQIIEKFTHNQNGVKQDDMLRKGVQKRNGALNKHSFSRPTEEVIKNSMAVRTRAEGEDFSKKDHHVKSNCDYFGADPHTTDYSIESLLHKIRNLENEKSYLLKFLENKKNVELEYKKALETQAAFVNSENKKSQFYENEWLHMKSLEYSFINSGKEPLRHALELFYGDSNLYEKLGNLTSTQEIFIANLVEDHKNLIQERNTISRKYQEAVDANFQLYQQNEMLKAQNINLMEKNKDTINEQLENKLNALNDTLICVQKENIRLQETVEQYVRLMKNINKCAEVNSIKDEVDKFKNYLLI
ncbi:hypothetical protein, conserved [Plasmodium gonderi]|uniref:Uncharacterized protein n=1 Tax=Plasmodium gonderi TaxID=77519 RepID=A0A1Y1JFD6_PLAGO|nr:hypothetical protein, conserved [Plasmodium gonderi]GAW79462.1 hypothetical protein, conserved [Plasmodium gonderi]